MEQKEIEKKYMEYQMLEQQIKQMQEQIASVQMMQAEQGGAVEQPQ